MLIDAPIERGQVLAHLIQAVQLHLEQKALRVVELAVEREREGGDLVAQSTARQLGHLGRRRCVGDQRAQHRHARDAEDVAGEGRQLDLT